MRTSEGNEERRWICPACREEFELLSAFFAHVQDAHPGEDIDLPDEKAG